MTNQIKYNGHYPVEYYQGNEEDAPDLMTATQYTVEYLPTHEKWTQTVYLYYYHDLAILLNYWNRGTTDYHYEAK